MLKKKLAIEETLNELWRISFTLPTYSPNALGVLGENIPLLPSINNSEYIHD